jgi:hypothetical protein
LLKDKQTINSNEPWSACRDELQLLERLPQGL